MGCLTAIQSMVLAGTVDPDAVGPRSLAGPPSCAGSGGRPGPDLMSHTGDLHFYHFCRGRQQHVCDLPYLPVVRVKSAVLDNYATIMLPGELRDQLATRIGGAG